MKLLDVYVNLEKEFSKRGFNLYIVGGTSRDMILGRKVLDFDFVTDAKIDEMDSFLNVKTKYNNVGSMTIEFEGKQIDLTTLRKESDYNDYRHPSEVIYVKTPKEDAARRDFTINALYFDKNGNLLDFYGGMDDIRSRLIRMIGDADKRIKEDPLRILRALRFSLILGFDIDNDILNAIKNNSHLLKELNYAKCLVEIKKMYAYNKQKAIKMLKEYGIDYYIPIEYGYEEVPVIDMHCDTITRNSVSEDGIYSNEDLHIDIKKMMKSHYMLQCFAVFIYLGASGSPFERANKYIDLFEKQMELNKNLITPVTHYSQVMNAFSQNKIAALLTIEEGGVLEGNIDNLQHFYNRGVRMMSLTWNFKNEISSPNLLTGTNDLTRIDTEHGLTPFGIEVVKKMNKLGMIIDVSHLSDAGFYDVIKYSVVPIVASHSDARAVNNCGRNLSDDMIKKIAEKHGLIGINFCPDFLKFNNSANDQVEEMVKHIKHIKEIGGIRTVALGTDFDGIPTPKGLEDASKMTKLSKRLLEEGFTQDEVEQIFYKNFLRLLKRVCK